jgi:hypothetical protein
MIRLPVFLVRAASCSFLGLGLDVNLACGYSRSFGSDQVGDELPECRILQLLFPSMSSVYLRGVLRFLGKATATPWDIVI